jgi:hypothetical protein
VAVLKRKKKTTSPAKKVAGPVKAKTGAPGKATKPPAAPKPPANNPGPTNPSGTTTTTTTGTGTTSTGASPSQIQQAADMAGQGGVSDGSGGAVTSGSTTAPADAYADTAQDQTDADLAAFFSTGTGPALHYDQTAMTTQQQAAGGAQ